MRANDWQLFASREISPDLYIARMKIRTQKAADCKKENSHEKKVSKFLLLDSIVLFSAIATIYNQNSK